MEITSIMINIIDLKKEHILPEIPNRYCPGKDIGLRLIFAMICGSRIGAGMKGNMIRPFI